MCFDVIPLIDVCGSSELSGNSLVHRLFKGISSEQMG